MEKKDTKDIRDIGDYKKYQRTMNMHDSKNPIIVDIRKRNHMKEAIIINITESWDILWF